MTSDNVQNERRDEEKWLRERRALAISEIACELSEKEQRRFLDGVCAGDENLRRDVDALLTASADTSNFLESKRRRRLIDFFDEGD
ncbi:MAG: hypothetical protein AAGH76_01390 [Pseudomonadota bacterium]